MPYASIIRADERVCARGEEQGVDFDLLSNVTYYVLQGVSFGDSLLSGWPGLARAQGDNF